jgi:hypothetical protein
MVTSRRLTTCRLKPGTEREVELVAAIVIVAIGIDSRRHRQTEVEAQRVAEHQQADAKPQLSL